MYARLMQTIILILPNLLAISDKKVDVSMHNLTFTLVMVSHVLTSPYGLDEDDYHTEAEVVKNEVKAPTLELLLFQLQSIFFFWVIIFVSLMSHFMKPKVHSSIYSATGTI